MMASNLGTPFKKRDFCYIGLLSTNLAFERLQRDTDWLLIITSTADDLSGGTNIDDFEQH